MSYRKLIWIINLIPRLGLWNIFIVIIYRIKKSTNYFVRQMPLGHAIKGEFYKTCEPVNNYPKQWRRKTLEKANKILNNEFQFFHHNFYKLPKRQIWNFNPYTQNTINIGSNHWSKIKDFDNDLDVKILWETSRFDWLTVLARAYRISGNEQYLNSINNLLENWSENNPLNKGVNWKCGQETSIRVMKLITTAHILKSTKSSTFGLQQMIFEHVKRINHTLNYAVAQNNNHGTSECASLYIGTLFLLNQKNTHPNLNLKSLKKIQTKSRKLLMERCDFLISQDGTFSQKSINYHRVVVDTLSWVLFYNDFFKQEKLPKKTTNKLKKLGAWQIKLIASHKSGFAPNIGANDGAMFENLHNSDFKDYRPSTQLFFALLSNKKVFELDEENYNEPLYWRQIEFQKLKMLEATERISTNLDDDLVILCSKHTKIYIKIPKNDFRPNSCDAFHTDIWYKNKNIFSDSGSYSYNSKQFKDYFNSISAHNSLQFENLEPMPKISRFLYGKWLKADYSLLSNKGFTWEGQYTDYNNNVHKRIVNLNDNNNEIRIIDTVIPKSKKSEISLFWHTQNEINEFSVSVFENDTKEIKPQILNTFYSEYYMNLNNRITYKFNSKAQKLTTIININ